MGLTVLSGDVEYIARTSGGKDSTKMLDVIVSRGLPLDRITKTDIWATDTIRGEHPKMVEFGIDEGLCGLFCQYEGILAPTYETGCRDGCWMCHNQGVNQLRLLRHDYPHLWALLLKWDTDSPVIFHPGKPVGHTVHDYDRRFELEDMGLIPKDRRFKWEMIYEMGLLMGPEWKGATI